MTALEETITELERARALALTGSEADQLRFAKLALGCWPTIHYALAELDRQRIA